MDAGVQAIADAAELSRVKQQARKVYVESVVFAGILTWVLFTYP